MAAVQAENIADMVVTSLNNFGKNRWTDLSYDIQEHVAWSQLLRKKKIQFEDGLQHEFQLMTNDSGQAENVELYQELTVGTPDVMKKGLIPMRHTNTKWAYDVREKEFQRGQAMVNSIVKVRRHSSIMSLIKLVESNFWSKPTDSTDEKTPWGIRMSIVHSDANTSPALAGGNPAGFGSGYAGVDSATYDQWQNWDTTYEELTHSDGISKIREMLVKSVFMAPVAYPGYQQGPPSRTINVNYRSLQALEDAARVQNDQLGFDVASTDGKTTFRRIPLTYVPQLDADATDPILGIDWSYLYPVFLAGFWMKEHAPLQSPNNPNVYRCHVDLSWNMKNVDRRRHWIAQKAA